MIRKNRGEIEWLEFNLLQGKGVEHGVYLRSEKLILPENALYFNQVHGKEVAVVSNRDTIFSADGGVTKTKELSLAIKHADCQAAIFYDPVLEVIATVHAGWRGLVQNIYKETVLKLKDSYHVNPENLIVCVGPSLEPEHSEFVNYKQEFPESFWRFQIKPNHFNLWDIAKFQLKELGISSQNIEIAGIGTYSNPTDFYSYRRSKDIHRNVTVASLI